MNTSVKVNDLLVLPFESSDNYAKLPSSILSKITDTNIKSPYYFVIINKLGLYEYIGVKEFTAEEGTIELPMWITEYLSTDFVNLKLLKNIPKGKNVVFEPQSPDFFEIPDNDKFLESALSNYCLLRKNQIIDIMIMAEIYKFKVVDFTTDKPINKLTRDDIIDIINIDINVDFINKFPPKVITPEPVPEIITPETNSVVSDIIKDLATLPKSTNYFDQLKDGQILSKDLSKALSKEEIRNARLAFYQKK